MVKKIHLSTESVQQKIIKIEQQLEMPINKSNKTKRKRLFSQLVKLRKALQNPQQQLIDPDAQMRKIQEKKEKRINKKIDSKKKQILERKKEKRYEKRCLKCGDRGHKLGDCLLTKGLSLPNNNNNSTEKVADSMNADDNNIGTKTAKPQNSHIKNQDEQPQFAGGYCYKCGSTTHSHKQCVMEGYKLAVCFYCGQKGHIARECQKNQKGLYRKGGSCFGCGSVRHTLKDCPNRRQAGNNYHNKQQF